MTRLALVWHMHQPSYRDPLDGGFAMPWVRLHALKDYLGMVEILRQTPGMRLTFNLVPSLLDQVESYARGEAKEALLDASLKPAVELSDDEKVVAMRGFFMAHRENLIRRSARFQELLEARGEASDETALRAAAARFTAQEFRDLQVVAKLAWFDLEWQRDDAVVRTLIAKGRGYTEDDKQSLAERECALLSAIVPAYRRAAESGQVELSTSPYYHPILPLLCDSAAHHEAHPGAPLPRSYRHPEDAADQIERAMARHASLFGSPPRGMWPSEGSVSDAVAELAARAGLAWLASDEGVLGRSLDRGIHRDSRGTGYPLELLYRPWRRRTASGDVTLAFRDRALSDLIGFSYAGVAPERAAQDMLERLSHIGERWSQQGLPGEPLVCVILDGENCWEHYPDGGRVFLRALYRGLQDDPGIEPQTLSDAIASQEPGELPRVFAGSWINADFSVWIGHADDRRAWDRLGEAREALETAASGGGVAAEAIARAREVYRAASGSDWCWWYGEDHSSENDFEFDRLFRRHLIAIYTLIGLPAPETLRQTLITTRRPTQRHSRPTGVVRPELDGRLTTPAEWVAAGVHWVGAGGSMHRGLPSLRAVRFGVGDDHVHVLVEASAPMRELLLDSELTLDFPGPTTLSYRLQSANGGVAVRRAEQTGLGWVASPSAARAAADEVLEVAIPVPELRPGPDRNVAFSVLIVQAGVELERHPDGGPIEVDLEEVARE